MYKISETCQIKDLNSTYEKYFGYRTDGFFIEVGAYDGYSFSNTWGLAEAGWKGIYFEPVIEYYKKCVKTHLKNVNISVVNLAISEFNGELTLQLGGALTSGSKKQIDIVKNLDWASGVYSSNKISCACLTLDHYLSVNRSPSDIDLLVIDVEGMEMNVLRGANLVQHKPKMLIIEAHENHPDIELRVFSEDINSFVYDAGYKKIYSDEINNIYLREEYINANKIR